MKLPPPLRASTDGQVRRDGDTLLYELELTIDIDDAPLTMATLLCQLDHHHDAVTCVPHNFILGDQ